jgi:signal peptidase II
MIAVFVVVFDQAVKWSVLAFLYPGQIIEIFPSFNLVLMMNAGTSFGLLDPHTLLQSHLIIILTILCILYLIYFFLKLNTICERVLCAFIIGGAIGNLLDRFFHGAVVDFIDLYYKEWHWPAFNVADSFISIGVISILIYNLLILKES